MRGIETEQEESRLIQVENCTEEDDLVTQFRDHNAGTEEPAEHKNRTHMTHTHTYNSDAGTNAHTFVDVGNDDQEGAILRRSTRESHRPDHYGVWIYTTSKEPTTVR